MIKEYLGQFGGISEEEIDSFIALGKQIQFKKGDFFIREGEVAREVAFNHSGIWRSFYISEKGEEITYCLTFPQKFLAAYSSYISGKETPENIQAMTDSELLVVSKEAIEKLVSKSYKWLFFMKTIAEQEYISLENRVFQLQRDFAAKRYEVLQAEHPEYIREIPLQYLASYLGITQRHLSRLRRQYI